MIASCPRIERIDYSIELEIEDPYIPEKPWNEISGSAISPKQVGPSGFPVLFGHNDGPDSRLVFAAWDSGTGRRLKTINIELDSDLPLFREDWEDMTIGNCGQDSSDTCIYIADTGDNRAQGSGAKTQRSGDRPYTIYKIKEPQISQIQDNVVLSARDHVSILQIDYKHFTSPTTYANCEAIFIDHTGWGQAGSIGDIYLVTKWNQPQSNKLNRLFKIPSSVWPKGYGEEGQYSPKVVGEYVDYSLGSFYNFTWTGGDMSLDGSKIALTWKFETHIFARCPGETVAEALAVQDIYSCVDYINPDEGAYPGRQYEAVSFSPDGQKLFNLAESLAPPKIIHVDLDYTTQSPTWMPSSTLTPTLAALGVPSPRIAASYGAKLGPGTELVSLVTMVVLALW
jgi:hypothetical protein